MATPNLIQLNHPSKLPEPTQPPRLIQQFQIQERDRVVWATHSVIVDRVIVGWAMPTGSKL